MNRSLVCRLLSLACGLALLVPTLATAQESPNVLWIIAEDLSPDLGSYGTEQVETPHLDRLAQRGMRFTHAFSPSPVCSPSRSALITGMYQTTIGSHHQRLPDSLKQPLPSGVQPLTDRLRRSGYFTANVIQFPEGIDFKGSGKTDWNFKYSGDPFDSNQWSDLKANQPFYAQVNFSEAHRGGGWEAPGPADPAHVSIPPYYPDHPVTREDWSDYLNAVSALDRKVGTVLEKLKDDGLAENTIVVFFGDHGRPMLRGKQWLYDSGLRVPLIVYWPGELPPPPRYEAGETSGQLVSLIDITATTLEIAGIEKPDQMQGRLLFGSHADPERQYVVGASDRDGEVQLRSRTVRTKRYRYIRNGFPERPLTASTAYRKEQHPLYHLITKLHGENRLTPAVHTLVAPRLKEELYDLATDPYEVHNLVDSPAHRDVLRKLRLVMNRWIERTGDQGQQSDPPKVVRYFEQYGKASARERADRIERTKRRVYQADKKYVELIRRLSSGAH